LKIDFGHNLIAQFAPGLAALIMLVIFRKENVRLTIAVTGAKTLKYIGLLDSPACFRRSFLITAIHRSATYFQPISGIALADFSWDHIAWCFPVKNWLRGYLQRIVESKANVLIASLLVACSGVYGMCLISEGPNIHGFFWCSPPCISVIMAWLLQRHGL